MPAGPQDAETGFKQVGLASWYGPRFHHKRTADGERFDMDALTAAHRSLPFNTYVRVTALESGRSLVVRVIDRGPYVRGRIIDLSAEAARRLGIKKEAVAVVRIQVVRIQAVNARAKDPSH